MDLRLYRDYLEGRGFSMDTSLSDDEIIFMDFIYQDMPFMSIEVVVGYGKASITDYTNKKKIEGFKIAHNFSIDSVEELDLFISKSPIDFLLN